MQWILFPSLKDGHGQSRWHSHGPPDLQQGKKHLSSVDDAALRPVPLKHVLQQLSHTLLTVETQRIGRSPACVCVRALVCAILEVCVCVWLGGGHLRLQNSKQRVRHGVLLELIGLVSAETNDVTHRLGRIGLSLKNTHTHTHRAHILCVTDRIRRRWRGFACVCFYVYMVVQLCVSPRHRSLGE